MNKVRKADAIDTFLQHVRLAMPYVDLTPPACEPEYHFHAIRQWRLDLAFPTRKIAVEVEGGLFAGRGKGGSSPLDTLDALARTGQAVRAGDVAAVRAMGGRHNHPIGMRNDLVKYNEATAAGWLVLRVMPEMITDGRALTWFETAWKGRSS